MADGAVVIVYSSRSGSTSRLSASIAEGSAEAAPDRSVVRLDAFSAGPPDVLAAAAVIIATPAHFGYMSGAVKDFLERIWHPCLDHTRGKPWAILAKGDTDVDGAVESVSRIVGGLGWRLVAEPVRVVGAVDQEALDAAFELGATVAAGVDAGMY